MANFPGKIPRSRVKIPVPVILFFSLLVTISATGCTPARITARAPLAEQGAVYLYLQPIPANAAKLSFTVERIAAVQEDGGEVPLTLRVTEISTRSVSRERLLATGELPPGRYRGISFKTKTASISGARDNAALQWTEEPSPAEIRFTVYRQKAVVLSAAFRYEESLLGGVVFTPRFAIVPAGKPPREILGYVVNRGSNAVTVFDRLSGQVSDVIPTGAAPGGIVVDSIPRYRAYVALSGDDAVEVIDLLRGDVIDRIRLRMGDRPDELALTPDGRTLLSVNTGSNTVSLIDTVAREERDRITVANGPRSILLDATGRRAYVFNTMGSGITVIDVTNRIVASTIATESAPLRGQFNRQGDRLYVIHQWSPYLLVIDPFTLSVIRKQYVGMGFQALTVDPTYDRIYMARKGGNEVQILDPFTLVSINFLGAGGEVNFMSVDGQEKSLLMLIPGKETLRVTDLIRGAVRAEVDVGEEPYWVAVAGGR
jgi:YVTN family beta-propeller protein